MATVEELKTKLKSLQTQKTQLNKELKGLKLKLELKNVSPKQPNCNQETAPQLKSL